MADYHPEICLAPLRGLTDAVYRNIYNHFFNGVDWAVTPFLTTVSGSRIKPSHLKEVLPENNRGLPVVPQILGNDPEAFVTLVKALFDLGYTAVNWNLGCPFARVAKKRRGSGLLPYPEKIEAFLEKVVRDIGDGNLSIKMRLGRYSGDEIFELLPVLSGYPLASITIHPRTGEQMYTGRPDLDVFEKCLAISRHTIIYNGDIVSVDDYRMLQQRFPQIRTWMIGRGILMDPFLPWAIKTGENRTQNWPAQFKQFHDALLDAYADLLSGPSHLLNKMKSLWFYFSHLFENGDVILKKVRKLKSVTQYRLLIDRFFADFCGDGTGSFSRYD